MEILGYIVSRDLVLVAINAKHIAKLDQIKLIFENAKKAYKIKGNVLLTMMGNPYKTTNIKKYILKLSELNSVQSFDSLLQDLNDIFNTAQSKMGMSIEKITKLLEKYKRDDGYVDTLEVEKQLDTQEEIMLLRDVTSSTLNNHNALCTISLFGYEQIDGLRIVHLISIGNELHDIVKNDLPKDQIFLQIINLENTDTLQLQTELVKQLVPFLPLGWHEDDNCLNNLLEQGKKTLIEGINQISLSEEKPNIVFYELSKRTGFTFTEPEIKLVGIDYNYANNDSIV